MCYQTVMKITVMSVIIYYVNYQFIQLTNQIAKEDKRLNAEALERNKKIVEIKKKLAINDKKQQKQYLKAVSSKVSQC